MGKVSSLVHLIGFILSVCVCVCVCVCEIVFYELYSGTRRTVTASSLQITFFFFFLTLRKEQGGSRRVLGFMAEAIPAASEGDALGQEVGSAPFSSSFLSPPSPLLSSPFPSFEIWPPFPVGLLREGRESATRGPLGCPEPAGRSARSPQSRRGAVGERAAWGRPVEARRLFPLSAGS